MEKKTWLTKTVAGTQNRRPRKKRKKEGVVTATPGGISKKGVSILIASEERRGVFRGGCVDGERTLGKGSKATEHT